MSRGPAHLVLALALAPAPVAAHPHVWVVASAGYRLEAGRVVAIEVVLRFDDLLSASLVADFDRDRDGHFDPAETARLERETFAGLAELDWLSHLRVAGRPAGLRPPSGFRAEIAGGIVTWRFERQLETPVDPRRGPLALTLVDPSRYVDIVLDPEAPAELTGEVPAGCGLSFAADTSFERLLAPTPPVAVLLQCDRSS
jgi:ABC-type uncharacterized transport system substrate-binding protein